MNSVQMVLLIIVSVVLVVGVLWAIVKGVRFYRKEHLECPNCGHHWKPPIIKMITVTNAVEGKIIRCPNCGEKNYSEPKTDSG